MPDLLLNATEYAEIRAAVLETFTDTVVVEQRGITNTPNGPVTTWSTRNTGQGIVRDLSGFELVRAQQYNREASVEVQIEALRAVEGTDRIKDTNWETGAVRYLQVLHVFKPSREFSRKVLAKQFS